MSDYVVKPKRRRTGALNVQAVDPCLGYYIPLADNVPTQTDSLDLVLNTPHAIAKAATQAGQRCRNPSPTSSSLELANAEWSTFVPVVSPPPQVVPSPAAILRHEKVLSVEEFLKRSTCRTYGRKGRVKKTNREPQRKLLSGQEDGVPHHAVQTEHDLEEDVVQLRSRRVVRRLFPSEDCSSEVDVETSSISFDPPTPLSEKKRQHPGMRQKLKNKPLKERIYEAAVATYCDPDPTFMHPEIKELDDGSVPLPLRFVPGPEPIRSSRKGKANKTKIKKRNWALVDPRKSMAIRTTTFSSRIRPPNLAFNNELLKDAKSVDTYKFTQLGAPSFKTMDRQSSMVKKTLKEFEKSRSVGLAPAQTTIACPPLTLVPIHEAEDNFSSFNFGRGVQVNQKTKSESTSSALHMTRLQVDKSS